MTSITQRDYRHMLLLLATQVIAVVVGIVTFILTTRLFEVSERGRFSFATSTTVFFTLLAELGTRFIATRTIVSDTPRSKKIYHHTVLARVLLSIVSLAFLLMLLRLVGAWRSEMYLLLVAGLGAVTQFSSDPAAWVFLAWKNITVYSVIQIIDRLLFLVFICISAIVFRTAEALLWAILIANLFRTLISWWRLRQVFPEAAGDLKWDVDILRSLIVDGGTVGIATIISVTYSQFTVVLLQGLVSPHELGIYTLAFGMMNWLLVVPVALTSAIFPDLSRQGSNQNIRQLYASVTQINLLTILPLAVGLMIFSPVAILIVGARYEAAIVEIQIMSVGMIALALNYVYRMFLLTQKRPWAEIFADVIAVGLIIVLSLVFCPLYGGLAMAIIFCLVEVCLLLIKIILTWRWMGPPPYIGILLRAIAATALATIITLRFDALVLQVVVYGVSCVVLLLAFRVAPPIDWQGQFKRIRLLLTAQFESR